MLLLIVIEIVLIIIAVLVIKEFGQIIFFGASHLLSTPEEIATDLIKELKPKANAQLYDLGCGRGSFLKAIAKQCPKLKCVGIEKSWLLYVLAKDNIEKLDNIKLKLGNIFKSNLDQADYIYLYQTPNMMPKLADKISKSAKPGTIIISYLFSLPNLTEIKKIDTTKGLLYFYRM